MAEPPNDGDAKVKVHTSKRRSLAKTVTWRLTGTLDTLILSWVITGSTTVAGAIALSEVGTKMLLYFLHERAWARVPWGTGKPRQSEGAADMSGMAAPAAAVSGRSE